MGHELDPSYGTMAPIVLFLSFIFETFYVRGSIVVNISFVLTSVSGPQLSSCGPFGPFLSYYAPDHPFLSYIFMISDGWRQNGISFSFVLKSVIETLPGVHFGPFLSGECPRFRFLKLRI